MEDRQISIVEALNQTQSWLNAGEYEKTIQACHEILSIEPGNPRALALLKQAEERRHQGRQEDPLAKLAVEGEPEPKPVPEPKPEPPSMNGMRPFSRSEKRQLMMAMLIPAILVVLIGGAVIWFLVQKEKPDPENPPTDSAIEMDHIQENEQRVSDILAMEKILTAYKAEHGVYPSPGQVETVLLNDSTFEDLPTDPRSGESDKAGRLFGYMYAVYNDNSEYILSGLFEDSRGFGSPWVRGASIKAHPDFRDTRFDHVFLIEGDGKNTHTETPEKSTPKVKSKPE